MRTKPKIAGYGTTVCVAALCLASTGGDIDAACALARERIPITDDALDTLCQVIRQQANVAAITALAEIIVEEGVE
jgi:hypothetical protein